MKKALFFIWAIVSVFQIYSQSIRNNSDYGNDGTVIFPTFISQPPYYFDLCGYVQGNLLCKYYWCNGIFSCSEVKIGLFNKKGIIVKSFGTNYGYLVIPKGLREGIGAAKVLPDGRILVFVSQDNKNYKDSINIYCYKSNGRPDSSFGLNGKTQIYSDYGRINANYVNINGNQLYFQVDIRDSLKATYYSLGVLRCNLNKIHDSASIFCKAINCSKRVYDNSRFYYLMVPCNNGLYWIQKGSTYGEFMSLYKTSISGKPDLNFKDSGIYNLITDVLYRPVLRFDSENNVYLGGYENVNNHKNRRIFLLKFDSTGLVDPNCNWGLGLHAEFSPDRDFVELQNFEIDKKGNAIIACEGGLLKLNKNGKVVKNFGQGGFKEFKNIIHNYNDPTDDIMLVQDSLIFFSGDNAKGEFFVECFRYDANAYDETDEDGIYLQWLGPNPAQKTVMVSYIQNTDDNLTMSLYNSIGSVVIQLTNPDGVARGVYKHNLDVSHFSAGVYFLVLQAGKKRISRKIVVE